MSFLEKDLEDILTNDSRIQLRLRGLTCFKYKEYKSFRQFHLTGYGVADYVRVIRQDGFLLIQVFELKKDKIHSPTFWQCIQYCRGIQRYLELSKFSFPVKLELVLIGSSIDYRSPLVYMPNVVNSDNFKVLLYNYKLANGIVYFQEQHSCFSRKENINFRKKK